MVNKVNLALEIVEAVHGAFVLFDPHSTTEEKAEALRNIALSGLGIAAYFELIGTRAAGSASGGPE